MFEFWMVAALLTFVSFGLMIWQWVEGRLFPLHRRVRQRDYMPSVTLLKPLKGCDAATEACLRSWLVQNYGGPVQTLFAVDSIEDPVCEMVHRLMAEHPEADTTLVVCPKRVGPNSKASKLAQVAGRAKHDLWILSDADVKAPPDLLINLVAPFQSGQTGLVTPFYRFAEPVTAAMQLEAVAVNADFWTSVLQAVRLTPMRFALGAVMAVPRPVVESMGGLGVLTGYLADDYELGRRVTEKGGRIVLCPVVVDCCNAPHGWGEVWRHQVRWARTIRACQPLAYGASLVSNPTLWPLAWLVLDLDLATTFAFGCCLLTRLLTAWDSQRRLNQSATHLRWIWLAPLKDLMQVAWWALAYLGRNVEWRGARFRVLRGGQLEPLEGPSRGREPTRG